MKYCLIFIFSIPILGFSQGTYLPLSGGTVNGYTQINNINFSGASDNYAGAALWQDVSSPYKTHLNGYALSFGTGANGNRLERMHIDNNGNIGIGTSTPQSPWSRVLQVYDYNNAAISVKTPVRDWQIGTAATGGLMFVDNTADGTPSRLTLSSNGNVGVGTSTPLESLNNMGLHIGRGGHSTLVLGDPAGGAGGFVQTSDNRHRVWIGANLYDDVNNSWRSLQPSKGAAGISVQADQGGWGTEIDFYASEDGSLTPRMTILANGNVGIGTIDPKGYRLAVNGDAIFTKIKVKQYSNWPDYVFASNYNLPTLAEVEKFIRDNSHLPGVPSAKEVEKNGLDLGDNQALLLKKIEELTLYMIELKKTNDKMEKRMGEQDKEIDRLKKMINQ